MKFQIIKYSIIRLIDQEATKTTKRHQKKLDALIVNKRIRDGVKQNPNALITNLTGNELSPDEVEILNLGIRYGIATRPTEEEMVCVMEDVWEQISKKNLINDNPWSSARVKTALRSFTYNYLDIDDKRYGLDNKRVKLIRKLKERYVILKPDKGSGIVLLNITDYRQSVEILFQDPAKFKRVELDPTISRLSTIQQYLLKLRNRGEIDEDEYTKMRPKAAHVSRAHGTPKIHKPYQHLPKFRPIIDTTGSPYQGVGKYLSTLLNPLTQNEFTTKDSFEAATKVRNIPPELFDQGYSFVSFDVESLFTNVPLKKLLTSSWIVCTTIMNSKQN